MRRKMLWTCILALALLLAAPGAAFADNPPVVTKDNFYDYFDKDGALLDSVTADTLVLAGEFDASDASKGMPYYIILDRSITLVGSKTSPPVLTEMTIVVLGDDVTLDGLTLFSEIPMGYQIAIFGDNAVVKNMTLTYKPGDEYVNYAIGAQGNDEDDLLRGLVIEDNTIVFETSVKEDKMMGSAAAIDLEFTDGAVISGNQITASTPGLDPDFSCYYEEDNYDDWGGLKYVCPVRILDSPACEFTDNTLEVSVNSCAGYYPSSEALLIARCDDALIQRNSISMAADLPAKNPNVLYGAICAYNEGLVFEGNSIDVSATGGSDMYAYGLDAFSSEGEITGNVICCSANGLAYGITKTYSFSFYEDLYDLTVQGNTVIVSGYCQQSSLYTGLFGVMIDMGPATVKGNAIRVANTSETGGAEPYVNGIRCVTTGSSGQEVDIEDNNIFTNGQYALSVPYTYSQVTVTGNHLAAAQLGGDDAVYAEENVNKVLIEDNDWPAAAPVFSPEGGTYISAADVTISCATEGTAIHYTLNGDDPTVLSEVYTQPIHLGETATIKAFAAVEGFRASADAAAVYTIFPPFGTATLTLPANTTTIGENAFEGDTSITAVNARSCTSIGAYAFKGCTSLTKIRLPKDCTVDSKAFTNCGTVLVYAPAGGKTQNTCKEIANCTFIAET